MFVSFGEGFSFRRQRLYPNKKFEKNRVGETQFVSFGQAFSFRRQRLYPNKKFEKIESEKHSSFLLAKPFLFVKKRREEIWHLMQE